MLNISVVGRNASLEDRMHYYAWDKKSRERAGFVEQLNAMELPYEASAGGQISVDVVPKGWNKAVAMPEILKRHPDSAIHFFGDRMGKGGNDRPLALALEAKGAPHKAVAVSGYEDCFRHLREEMLLADTRAA